MIMTEQSSGKTMSMINSNQIVNAGKVQHMRSGERRSEECWEMIYCTRGSVCFYFNSFALACEKGQIAVIPPDHLYERKESENFSYILLSMQNVELNSQEPFTASDDANHFILDAFTGALFYYKSDPLKYQPLLSAYGALIAAFLSVNSPGSRQDGLAGEIQCDILKNHRDSSYELDQYLHSFPYSYDYIRKLFKKTTGATPHQYLLRLRLHDAAELLSDNSGKKQTINDITRICGFRDAFYFSRMFKKKYGVSPSAYRKTKISASF